MMKNEEIARKLYVQQKKGIYVNHQERELIGTAARRLEEDAEKIADLRHDVEVLSAQVKELKYRLAEREGIQAENVLPAVSEGKVDEDFWDDFWPTEGDA